MVEGALEVRHRQVPVDRQPLDLMEHRGVGGVQLVGPVHPAGADDVDRRLRGRSMVRTCTGEVWVRSTRPDLDVAVAVGARDVERVLHGPRGVVLREVQRVEVEPLGLELRALRDLPAHRDEDVLDPGHHRGDRVPGACRLPVVGQGDVDGLLGQHPGVPLGDQHAFPLRDRRVDLLAGPADRPPAAAFSALGRSAIARFASANGLRSPA